jgi:hypothetical protein
MRYYSVARVTNQIVRDSLTTSILVDSHIQYKAKKTFGQLVVRYIWWVK